MEKHLVPLAILQILRQHSDQSHKLTQDQVLAYLSEEYGIQVERRSVSRQVDSLIAAGIDIVKAGRGVYLAGNLFDFDDSELKVLMDAVVSSSYIPAEMATDLIGKLRNLSGDFFPEDNLPVVETSGRSKNKVLFLNVELIQEAIRKKRKIAFDYYRLAPSMELELKDHLQVSPYMTIVKNQRYYLLCHHEGREDIAFLRLDLIKNVEILGKHALPITSAASYLKAPPTQKDLAVRYPYLFSGPCSPMTLRVKKDSLYTVVDWFGDSIVCRELPGTDLVEVSLTANLNAMVYWCLQYSDGVELVSPPKARELIRNKLEHALKMYEG